MPKQKNEKSKTKDTRRGYNKEYYQRPEVKARIKEYQKEYGKTQRTKKNEENT